MKAAERIIEALNELMEAYCELQESIEKDFTGRDVDPESPELSAEVDSAIVTEVRAAVESVMESEDYSAEEIASVISTLTDAVEEIDPDVFEERRASADSEEDEEYYDDDDDDDDDDDLDEDDEEEDEDDDDYEDEKE